MSYKIGDRHSVLRLLRCNKCKKISIKLLKGSKFDVRLNLDLPRYRFRSNAQHLGQQSTTLFATERNAQGCAAGFRSVTSKLLACGVDGVDASHQKHGYVFLVVRHIIPVQHVLPG